MYEWLNASTLPLENKEFIVKHWGIKNGLLVLSNHRIIQLNGNKKTYYLNRSIKLEAIKSISGSGGLWSQNVYVDTIEGRYTFEGIHPKEGVVQGKMPREDFKELTLTQLTARLSENKTMVMDFSFLRTHIENGGLVLTTMKCPECKAPIEMPTNGTETTCKYCGSIIRAEDIFAKIKNLL